MSKLKFEPGTKFGKWTVIGEGESYVRPSNPKCTRTRSVVQCECGAEKTVVNSKLKSGKSTQCRSCATKEHLRKLNYGSITDEYDLYFVAAGKAFKIGVAKDVKRRIKEMQTDNHEKIELLYHGVGEGKDEEMWHKIFAHRHLHGEWFER